MSVDVFMYDSKMIAKRIRTVIKQQGKTSSQILAVCKLGKNTISKIENGTDILTLNFAKIADSLNCSVDYLLGRTDTPILLFEKHKNSQKTGYSSSEVAAQIKEKLKEKKITAKKMLSDLGLSSATLGHYETSMPKADNLALIWVFLLIICWGEQMILYKIMAICGKK